MSDRTPGLKVSTLFLVGLALSVGWGIRGQFGHETGAMLPGALASIAVCLLSGREDWRRRVAYFAFFGALGWAFGGSMSYMNVLSYTHSGHLPTRFYGFTVFFLLGFLWTGLGGAGTAFPAVADRRRMTEIFVPILWVFAFWVLLSYPLGRLEEMLVEAFDPERRREIGPFEWFDSDWLQAATALLALFCFDLWDRRLAHSYWLFVCGILGAITGYATQYFLREAGFTGAVFDAVVHYQGDLDLYPAEVLRPNWPTFLMDLSQHAGWIAGLVLGICLYFAVFGRFRKGASMLVHMAAGWWIGFLVLTVFLGLRMTPPRGDNWAGLVGLMLGLTIYLLRNGLAPVVYSMFITGALGGLSFTGVALLVSILQRPGNPNIVTDPAVVEAWSHWHRQNWHSFLEQATGFFNGVALAIALGLLARRARPAPEEPGLNRWTQAAAVVFAWPVLVYLNLWKNIEDWVVKAGTVPERMKVPMLFPDFDMSAMTWFNIVYAVIAAVIAAAAFAHLRRPLAVVPATWVGRGQLLFLMILWTMTIGNFEKLVVQFTDQRILTEGTVFVNAALASLLILLLPREDVPLPDRPAERWGPRVVAAAALGVVIWAIQAPLFTYTAHTINHGQRGAMYGRNVRLGPDADWRVSPRFLYEPKEEPGAE